MAYLEQDRVWIRHWVGYGAIFQQAEPRLENAITATQAVSDGGSRPDSSTENFIKSLIFGSSAPTATALPVPGPTSQSTAFAMPATIGLLGIEQQLSAMWGFTYAAGKQDEVTVDTARGAAQLRREGRRLANSMARMLGMRGVRADMFSSGQTVVDDDPFSYSDLTHWSRGP